MIKTETRLAGDIEQALQQFAKAAQENIVRPGVQAAAEVFYVEAKLRCPVSEAPHMFHGTHQVYGPYSPGSLRDAIYQVYSKDRSRPGAPVYHVSWNHKKVPYGFMVEFGTSKQPGHPFIRPAFEAMKSAAGDAALVVMGQKMSEVAK